MSRIKMLQDTGLVDIYAELLECLDNGNITNDEILALLELKKDDRVIAGRKISSIAKAVLEINNIESIIDDIDAKELANHFRI